MGVEGFHPRDLWDLSGECCGRILTLLHKVEMAGVWPANASTLFFVIPKSTSSDRPIALFATLIRRRVWLKALAVVEWKVQQNVAGDGLLHVCERCGLKWKTLTSVHPSCGGPERR